MMTVPTTAPPPARKDGSQVRQKAMIARHFDRLAAAPDTGARCAYTFVPGNLTELLLSFDVLPVLPEINALQSAMRGKTAEYIAVAEKLGVHLAILQDLSGPKIRTGLMGAGTIELKEGARFTLTSRDVPGDETEVGLTYPDLPHNVRTGDAILLADGAMELEVQSASDTDVVCTVTVGGELSSNKGINLPGRSLNAPILSAKDKADLAVGVDVGVDYVALSFVQRAEDVLELQRELERLGCGDIPKIAKIEGAAVRI